MGKTHALSRTIALAVSLGVLMSGLVGCGVGTTSSTSTPVTITGLGGHVYGGEQPISGSNIQLFSPGTTGYGSASIPLLNRPVTSDANGNFSLTGTYTCPSSSTPVYVYITGGNPGLAPGTNNAAISLMASVGFCGDLTSSTFLVVNEMTTVAAVWSLAPFMVDGTHIGTSPTNVQGLINAVETSVNLVSPNTGVSPGSAPAIATVPVAEIHTLGDILTSCVNSNGSTSPTSSCGRLFTAATPLGGIAPTDIVTAALDIARNPGHNAGSLFSATPSSGPFVPYADDCAQRLDDRDSVFFAGVQDPERSGDRLAGECVGAEWLGREQYGECVECDGDYSFVSSARQQLWRIALDVNDDPWLTNPVYSNVVELTNSGARATLNPFSGAGLQGPGALAFDGAGNVWVANNGPTVSELNASGTAMSSPAGFSTGARVDRWRLRWIRWGLRGLRIAVVIRLRCWGARGSRFRVLRIRAAG